MQVGRTQFRPTFFAYEAGLAWTVLPEGESEYTCLILTVRLRAR